MKGRRLVLGSACAVGLALVYLFQKTNAAAFLGVDEPTIEFLFNRTLRFVLNDVLVIGIIYAIFARRDYIIFALWVQLVGVIFFLIPYFILKLKFPASDGPLISYLHRLVLNPTLLLLLIPALFYQERVGKNDKTTE